MVLLNSTRKYPERPILAVSGIVFYEDLVLIVQRAKEPGRGLWSLPGGAVKPGETLHRALKRELQEECGISVLVKELYGAFDRIFWESDRVVYHYVILNYLCHAESNHLQIGSDVADARWIALPEIDAYPFTEGIPQLLRKVWGESQRYTP